MLQYGEEQLECIKEIVARIQCGQKVSIIWGPAGSGKTSIVSGIVQKLNLKRSEITFATFTGKASLVLRKKGLPSSTIHKLIYRVYKDKKTKKIRFVKKDDLDNPFLKLIVIDEYAMVGDKLFEDLLSFNIPILCLGDPYQLPPVKDLKNKYSDKCDFLLTKNYRQKDGNTILDLANQIKNGEGLKSTYNDNFIRTVAGNELDLGMLLWADQILCCTNKVRKQINSQIRDYLGYKEEIPVIGDKVICTKNDWDCLSEVENEPLINGMIGIVTKIINKKLTPFDSYMDIEFRPEHNLKDYYNIRIDLNPFLGYAPYQNKFNPYKPMIKRQSFDFGYAISVHKSQGSEWDKILLYTVDSWGDNTTQKQLLYTGVTRAKEKLLYIQ